jgi:hypothetical protein
MMMRPPLFMCFSAACVVANTPRMLMSITRSISSSVVSSNVFGMAVPALFTSTSSRPKVATVFSTAPLTASAVGSVRLDRDRLSAAAFNRFDHGGRVGVLRVGDGHACSVGGQTFCDRCANAPRTAGNECHFLANLDINLLLAFCEQFTTPLIRLTAALFGPVRRF